MLEISPKNCPWSVILIQNKPQELVKEHNNNVEVVAIIWSKPKLSPLRGYVNMFVNLSYTIMHFSMVQPLFLLPSCCGKWV